MSYGEKAHDSTTLRKLRSAFFRLSPARAFFISVSHRRTSTDGVISLARRSSARPHAALGIASSARVSGADVAPGGPPPGPEPVSQASGAFVPLTHVDTPPYDPLARSPPSVEPWGASEDPSHERAVETARRVSAKNASQADHTTGGVGGPLCACSDSLSRRCGFPGWTRSDREGEGSSLGTRRTEDN